MSVTPPISVSSDVARLPGPVARRDPVLHGDFNAVVDGVRTALRELGVTAGALAQLEALGVTLDFPARVVGVNGSNGPGQPVDAASITYDVEALRSPAIGVIQGLTPSMGRPVRADIAPRPPIIPAPVGARCTLRVEGFDLETGLPVSGLDMHGREVVVWAPCGPEPGGAR